LNGDKNFLKKAYEKTH
jgi:hypothetical protein